MSRDIDRCLAVVPARGDSKGLPGKNIRKLAGLPLLVHSLRCAAMVPRITRTIVSTDSPAIADVAREHGADVPFVRPAELARDDSPMLPVLTHALAEIERAEGRRYGSVLLLDPTSPGRLPEDVERALDLLAEDDVAVGVIGCSQPTFNPFWVGVVVREGYLAAAFEQAGSWHRRQDAPPFLRINGALYLWRSDLIRRSPAQWLDEPHRALVVPEQRAFSIDDEWEFELAQLLVEHRLVNLPWLAESHA